MATATDWRAREASMKRLGWVLVAVVCGAAPVAAQEQQAQVEQAQDTARVHVVRKGDTLWDLARQYLSDPFRWPQIHELNSDRVKNPHRIYPRERILIPGLLVQPLAGGEPAQPTEPADAGPVDPEFAGPPADDMPRTVFFGQDGSRVERRTFVGAQVESVPVVREDEYLAAGLLVPETAIQPVGRLTELLAPTVVPIEIPAHAQTYDKMYMAITAPDAVVLGDVLQIIRPGRRVRSYGRIHEITGIAEVVAVDGQTATLEVVELFDAVEVGNLAVALPEFPVPAGVTPVPTAGPQGRLLAFVEPEALHANRDIGFVDLGRRSGVVEGDEFLAILPPERRSWGMRPEIVVARLQAVRVTENTSAVRVVETRYPALEPGLQVRLVAKMPGS